MPVFDFSNMQAKKEPVRCTYAMVYSDNDHASPENPILVIDNQKREWKHHSFGIFANPNKQTTFEFEEEDGITYETPSATSIIVSGINKEEVGDCAARIRATRAPEPYKGKGIRYVGEFVRRKEGKTGN